MATNKKNENTVNERVADANPEVRDASPLAPTPESVENDLKGHSEVEQRTGVQADELDTRPVVDANPGDGKTFAERTREQQPWKEFQDQAAEAKAKAAADANEARNKAAKEDN